MLFCMGRSLGTRLAGSYRLLLTCTLAEMAMKDNGTIVDREISSDITCPHYSSNGNSAPSSLLSQSSSGVARSKMMPGHCTSARVGFFFFLFSFFFLVGEGGGWGHAPLVNLWILEVATQIVLETIFEMLLMGLELGVVLTHDFGIYAHAVLVFTSIKCQTCEQ